MDKKLIIDFSSILEGYDYTTINEKKVMSFHGLFSKADVVNGNNRTYPEVVLKCAVNKLLPAISERRITGELGHPAERMETLPDMESHLIVELNWNGLSKEASGRAEVLNYGPGSKGFLLEQRFLHKVKTGLSSRGSGSLRSTAVPGVQEVCEDLEFITYDVVCDPSSPGSWMDIKEAKLYEQVLRESKKQVGSYTFDREFKKILHAYIDVAGQNTNNL